MKNTRMFLVLLAVATSGCELDLITKQAQAKTAAVSTILSTPPIEVKAGAVAGNGFDASFDFDAGFLLDAGIDAGVILGDAGFVLPAQNLAFVYLGTRGASLDVAPTGLPGAQARLIQVGGSSFPLDDQGGGTYALSPDAGFVYVDDATYQFEFKSGASTFLAEVKNVPPRENIAQFHPAAGYVEINAGEDFTFTRPDPQPGLDRNFGFVNVFPVSQQGQGQPTYTNIPMTPLAFLRLIAFPQEWKSTSVTIPGSAFPERDHNYIVLLQSAKLGGPKSDNLFSGSAILAGTADVAIVKTRK
ncbi:MAG: hypothetical protein JNM17_28265 [Archangium sp.]|nr:hypothetical protein [Archangium sp.]